MFPFIMDTLKAFNLKLYLLNYLGTIRRSTKL